jgi:hypothetical protein
MLKTFFMFVLVFVLVHLKSVYSGPLWWLMPIILLTPEVDIERIMVPEASSSNS